MNRINLIKPTDKYYYELSEKHWNSIAKPLGSFGLLEDYIKKISAVQCTEYPDISKRTVVVMCADNGVVCEGVTQVSSDVTAKSACAIANGTSNINALARTFNADVLAVDIGIKSVICNDNLINKKIKYGTENIAKRSAMTLNETEKAIQTGMDIVKELKDKNTKIIVTGEMGIGNTTTSSALSAVLLDCKAEDVTGKGAGLSDSGLNKKIEVIKKAISVNKPDSEKPLELLSKLGGLDIAGMTGIFLGGGYYGVAIVADGLISAVSAVIACKLNSSVKDYILASHVSKEPAGRKLLDLIGLKPIIDGELRLGEGTGGILLLPLLDGALSLYRNSHSFENLGIERYKKL